jgi:hypothetical protein
MRLILKLVIGFPFFTSIANGSEAQRPLTIIFLDIDGVLMDWSSLHQMRAKIGQKAFELFGGGYYTDLQWKTAGSHFFSESAVENLEKLIERTHEVADVAIVLSSTWRFDCTVDEIKNKMFAVRLFSKLIIDKLPDDDGRRKKRGEEGLSPIALLKYGFHLDNRGSQIDYWLRENQENLNVQNFVIIDDVDDGISSRFADNFVKIREFLSPSEARKAYEILAGS